MYLVLHAERVLVVSPLKSFATSQFFRTAATFDAAQFREASITFLPQHFRILAGSFLTGGDRSYYSRIGIAFSPEFVRIMAGVVRAFARARIGNSIRPPPSEKSLSFPPDHISRRQFSAESPATPQTKAIKNVQQISRSLIE